MDRHIGISYKKAVYKAVRSETMRLIKENKGKSLPRIKPLAKRVHITKIVAHTHGRLAGSGVFTRAFLATGTWLPTDHSADDQVDLQGVIFDYKEVVTPEAIGDHAMIVEAQEAKAEVERRSKNLSC